MSIMATDPNIGKQPLRFYMEGFLRNSDPTPPLDGELAADHFEVDYMISKPKETLKRIFARLEEMDLNRETKKLALWEIAMALIAIIHKETK
jgi:hypothetical protein